MRLVARLVPVLVLVVAAGAIFGSGHAAAASGDRVLIGAGKLTSRPYRSIILVSIGSRVVCTGFVVGARKVVTAAHCLTRDPARGDYRFRKGLPRKVRLYRAYSSAAGGATFPTCRIARAWAHPRFIRRDADDERFGSRAHDYAVLTTRKGCSYPRNARMRLWSTSVAEGQLSGGDDVKIGGYPSDPRFEGMNGLNLWRSSGTLVANVLDPQMLFMTGFVAQGMSGGPIWRSFGSGSPCGRKQCVVGVATECAVNRRGLCKLGDSVRRAVRISTEVRREIRRH